MARDRIKKYEKKKSDSYMHHLKIVTFIPIGIYRGAYVEHNIYMHIVYIPDTQFTLWFSDKKRLSIFRTMVECTILIEKERERERTTLSIYTR